MCRRLEYVHDENHLSFIKAFSWRADDLNKIWDLEIFIGIRSVFRYVFRGVFYKGTHHSYLTMSYIHLYY